MGPGGVVTALYQMGVSKDTCGSTCLYAAGDLSSTEATSLSQLRPSASIPYLDNH